MKQTGKKTWSVLLTLALMLSLVPAFSSPALAADNSTDYTLTIPATLTVADSGWNATDGLTAKVKDGDSFDASKKLTVPRIAGHSSPATIPWAIIWQRQQVLIAVRQHLPHGYFLLTS